MICPPSHFAQAEEEQKKLQNQVRLLEGDLEKAEDQLFETKKRAEAAEQEMEEYKR